jgi:hypothetical protein
LAVYEAWIGPGFIGEVTLALSTRRLTQGLGDLNLYLIKFKASGYWMWLLFMILSVIKAITFTRELNVIKHKCPETFRN